MSKRYTYKAFGLTIRSEIEIPEFIKSKGNADVDIVLDKLPKKLTKITKQGVKYQATKNEFLLKVDNIAKYFVRDGDNISIELLKEKADGEVRLFLLGSAFGALFVQRGLLPIHGSTIKFGNSAAIFTGLSGVGKSSIAAHFVHKGFKALADDISVINHELKVVPGFPSLKIWNDVLLKLQVKNESLNQIRPNIKKFQLPISDNYCSESIPLQNIVLLNTKNSPGFEIEEITGIKKFNAIKNNTYRYRFVSGLEKQLDHFQLLNKLLPEIKVYKVSRPQAPLSLDEFGDYLLKNMELDA
ncbi:MAG: hypothetical protein C0597_16115 [Marinilabiliales bacterium]|nr:MAG: hypothetical protein C0597_16115 [Marinilabiliales bacterium]